MVLGRESNSKISQDSRGTQPSDRQNSLPVEGRPWHAILSWWELTTLRLESAAVTQVPAAGACTT